MPLTKQDIEKILQDVTFPGWKFHLNPTGGEMFGGWLLQGMFLRPDARTGVMGEGHSRTEYLTRDCTEDSIVKTCWVIVKLTVEHEAMEFFEYSGRRVFDPHTPVDVLIGLQAKQEEQ